MLRAREPGLLVKENEAEGDFVARVPDRGLFRDPAGTGPWMPRIGQGTRGERKATL